MLQCICITNFFIAVISVEIQFPMATMSVTEGFGLTITLQSDVPAELFLPIMVTLQLTDGTASAYLRDSYLAWLV